MADVTKGIPFKDESVDVAIIEQVLEHIANPIDALKEMAGSLNPEGFDSRRADIPRPGGMGEEKVTAYAAKRFNITRGHVQTFTMKKTTGAYGKDRSFSTYRASTVSE